MNSEGARRFCDSCQKHVHDFSNLTRRQAAELLENSKGGVCGRLTFDSRGKIIFRDPPAKWTTRLAPISLMGVSALFAQARAFAQTGSACRVQLKVTDMTGAGVPGAHAQLLRGEESVANGKTSDDGTFATAALPSGSYNVQVEAPGFLSYRLQNLQLKCERQQLVNIEVPLQIGGLMGDVVEIYPTSRFQRVRWRVRYMFHRVLHRG